LTQRKSWLFGLIVLGLIIAGFLFGRFEFIVEPTLQPITTVAAASPVVTPLGAQPASALITEPEPAAQTDQAQTKTAAAKTSPAHAKPATTQALPLPVKTIGSKNAPITMEVFSDYQCPSCGSLYEQTLRPMISDYVASGKVYLVHRDFPLPMHPYGYEAARWVNAAARIGKYEEAEAALYDNQKAWSIDGSIEKYIAGAMSAADFKRVQKMMVGCSLEVKPPASADSPSGCPLDANIEADKQLGNQIPVKATPTFITSYKGQKYPAASGVISWPVMKQYFDSLLAQ
jgi:protein-disulfide isomerase